MTATHWICLTAILLCAACAQPDHRPINVSDDHHKTLGPDDVTPIVTCAAEGSSAGCGGTN
ncbi:exported protein of unknown function [Candidatus Filomicrobium marinum]|nr:exported protein of unknown function [Candidatus Filomicrobium marinum]